MDKALAFIANQLNTSLKNQFGISEDMVTIGRLKNLDGTLSKINENKLVLSVVNISLENEVPFANKRMGFAAHEKTSDHSIMRLNTHVLLAANYNKELEGLKILKSALQYFQMNPSFDNSNSPELHEEIDRITIEAHTLSLQEIQSVWSSLGCNALPSMFYKFRILEISR